MSLSLLEFYLKVTLRLLYTRIANDRAARPRPQLHHGSDYTPYEGHVLEDWPRYTLLRGKVVYDGETNEVLAKPGDGKFLVRGKSSLP